MSKALNKMVAILNNVRNSNIESRALNNFVRDFSGVYCLERASSKAKMLFKREFALACATAVKFEGCDINEVLKLKEV